jgi:secondary thiamine-phosphate synthase enzyme
MIIHNSSIKVVTVGFSDCKDITRALDGIIVQCGVRDGLLTVMNPGSTGAITTIEFESGAVSDLKTALDRIAPIDLEYAHNARWGDGNGFSHVRAALMKPSLTIPIVAGKMTLGPWQQVVFLDFDNKPRTRSLVVQVIGQGRV